MTVIYFVDYLNKIKENKMAKNIFETASRAKVRFETTRGLITTEDLWDLPLTAGMVNLDNVAKAVNKRLRETEESFVVTTKKDKLLELKLDVVKHVIAVKLEEVEDAKEAAKRAEKKEILSEAIAIKEVSELVDGKSVKELKKELRNA